MIRDLKPYPAYRDSGVEWLGEVPEGWASSQVKRHYAIQLGKMLQGRPLNPGDQEMPYLKAQHVQWFAVRTSGAPRMWASPAEVEQFAISPGDLLVCEGGEGGRCGLVGGLDGRFIIQNALHRVRPLGDYRNDYLQYVMSAIASTNWFDAINNRATIAHFTREKFGALRLSLPPPSEQSAIVRFLDHVDRRIRRYIHAKQKLIALLNEQKQAIIHRAVTWGLDPEVRLKPSGVEWLGDVPEHWEIRRLKYLSPQITVGVVVNPSSYFVEHGVPMLLGNNVLPGRFKLDKVRRIGPESNVALKKSQLRAGDVVVVRVGAPGVASVVPDELDGCNCASMMIVRRGRHVEPLWMEYLFNSPVIRRQIDMVKYGAAQKQFNISHAVEFLALVPVLEEQRRIIAHVKSAVHAEDAAVGRVERQIALLREFRTRLIADVVTGKLDVREAAARLPVEAEEPELLDTLEIEATDPDADLDDILKEAEA
jgi:type I restriction enzyme S subunit